jgi:hypothetical protein
MTDKMFNIVGVSTQRSVTKFRVANGEIENRVKILERAGCTDIKFIKLDTPMNKLDAIAAFKAQHPKYANVRMPNDKTGTKTVKVARKTKAVDPATAVLKDAETKTETEAA